MAAPGDFVRSIMDQARARAQSIRSRARSRVQGLTGRALPGLPMLGGGGGGSNPGATGVLEAAVGAGGVADSLLSQVKNVRERVQTRIQQVTRGRVRGGLIQRVVAPLGQATTQPGGQVADTKGAFEFAEVV